MLDEPTSALEHGPVQVQIVELLRALQRKPGIAYLFISHDLKVGSRALSHKVIVDEERRRGGKRGASTTALFGNPQSDYTRELMRAAFGHVGAA